MTMRNTPFDSLESAEKFIDLMSKPITLHSASNGRYIMCHGNAEVSIAPYVDDSMVREELLEILLYKGEGLIVNLFLEDVVWEWLQKIWACRKYNENWFEEQNEEAIELIDDWFADTYVEREGELAKKKMVQMARESGVSIKELRRLIDEDDQIRVRRNKQAY